MRWMMEKTISINRPSGSCQAKVGGSGLISHPAEVAVDAGDDAFVTGGFGVPSSALGVVPELVDVGELGFKRWLELWGRKVVVALFADVGVGAGVGDEVAGAVAVRYAGL